MEQVRDSSKPLQLLSELLLNSPFSDRPGTQAQRLQRSGDGYSDRVCEQACALSQKDLDNLLALANTNHVVMRAFPALEQILRGRGAQEKAEWAADAVRKETERIDHAVSFLAKICSALETGGCPVTVIKSLDHWPDLGSDLDLYTDADPENVIELMNVHFKAKPDYRSWGDRLANKWNFVVPGLPELIEIHIKRMGQTGEQTAVTRSLSSRTRMAEIRGQLFRVPAPEDRFVISTLQRMYRHFYIRLCDIVDNARLLDLQLIDFSYLHSLGSAAGLWEGIATYLKIISEYVEAYRGSGVPLPSLVTGSAKFGTDQVRFRKDFLRVSILPHSMNLYASELMTLLLKGELRNSFRLSLLPGLATAAALGQKITGSDKGIW